MFFTDVLCCFKLGIKKSEDDQSTLAVLCPENLEFISCSEKNIPGLLIFQ